MEYRENKRDSVSMVRHNLDKVWQVKTRGTGEPPDNSVKSCITHRFAEFCKRTDLHGFKYMVMEELNGFERASWTVAVVLSIFFAAYFVVTAYNWYARNPIVTVIESTQGAIWDVPFPAVTICDLNLVSKKAAKELASSLKFPDKSNITSEEVFKTLQMVPVLYSKYNVNRTQLKSLHRLQEVLDLNNISVDALFKRLSPSTTCDQLIHRCMWKNTIYRCDQIFSLIFVETSFCCTFNYFATKILKDRTLSEVVSPRRVASCGSQTALTVLINNDLENYYSTPVASQGVLIFVDNAYNHPTYESPIRVVNPFTEVRIALSPERTYANQGLKAFTPSKRHCYYSNEMKLSIFERYTFHNCVAYKKVEVIINTCDCVPLHFPTKENHRPCNFYDITCLDGVTRPIQDTKKFKGASNSKTKCLPECEHFDYPLEVALGRLSENGQRFTGLPFFDNVNLQNKSLLSVFFGDLVSTRYRRDVYLNWQNILATFGGLLSLMLGFTLISGFDLIIFCTFRPAYESITYFFKRKDDKNMDNAIYSKKEYNSKINNWTGKPIKISSIDLAKALAERRYAQKY